MDSYYLNIYNKDNLHDYIPSLLFGRCADKQQHSCKKYYVNSTCITNCYIGAGYNTDSIYNYLVTCLI